MEVLTLRREQWVDAGIDAVFDYFADAANLEAITPPWLRFQILTPLPITMAEGTQIAYRLRWRMVPLRWLTEITSWEPPFRFVDEQKRGPYRLWHHTHTFHDERSGTRIVDEVRYALPRLLGPCKNLMHRLIVRGDLDAIFDYRADVIRRTFQVQHAQNSQIGR